MLACACIVMLIHGGGWIIGGPGSVRVPQLALRRSHIPSVAVSYPLGNPVRAYRVVRADMKREARRHRRVFLVGWSVGGTMALRLGESGLPAAVAAVEPVADLTHWRVSNTHWVVQAMLDRRTRARLDPSAHSCRHESRTLLVHSDNDPLAPYSASVRYARRCHAKLITLHESHGIMNAGWLHWIERLVRSPGRHARARR